MDADTQVSSSGTPMSAQITLDALFRINSDLVEGSEKQKVLDLDRDPLKFMMMKIDSNNSVAMVRALQELKDHAAMAYENLTPKKAALYHAFIIKYVRQIEVALRAKVSEDGWFLQKLMTPTQRMEIDDPGDHPGLLARMMGGNRNSDD